MKKPSIPAIPSVRESQPFASAVKETLEIYTGAIGGKLTVLPTTATLTDVIKKINAIIAVLQ